jgi:sulfatase modifying factor 1
VIAMRRFARGVLLAAVATGSCDRRDKRGSFAPDGSVTARDASLGSDEPAAPPHGMVWIGPGPLVVGTPPNVYPRRSDRELAGEQFVMHGFYIDILPFPNEEGAIPTTNVSQSDARALCSKQGKRLCSELEWERACKGPLQHTYECGTGTAIVPRPSGIRVGCQSDFGVHDLHGGVFEWTESPWARGSATAGKVAIRGGNDPAGEVVGRCANAEPLSPEVRSSSIGFRCCAGPVNEVQIQMRVDSGPAIAALAPDAALLRRLLEHLPAGASAELGNESYTGIWSYVWRPIGNERLVAVSMCARGRGPQHCAVLVGRDTPGLPAVLAAASTGFFPSKLYADEPPRDVWLLGTDANGPFRRLLRYDWGRVDVGPRERQTTFREQHKSHERSKKSVREK